MSDELLSCPFCGDEYPVTIHNTLYYDPIAHQIKCFSCGASTELHEKETEAIAAWNRRALPAATSQPNAVPLYTDAMIDDIVDNHIFLDNGTSTYRIFEDRAYKYLREMRDKYEQEIAWWQRYGMIKLEELVEAKAKLEAAATPQGEALQPDWVVQLLEAAKMAYRKHHLGDDTVGWDELSEKLQDALCEAMGDAEFVEWLTQGDTEQ